MRCSPPKNRMIEVIIEYQTRWMVVVHKFVKSFIKVAKYWNLKRICIQNICTVSFHQIPSIQFCKKEETAPILNLSYFEKKAFANIMICQSIFHIINPILPLPRRKCGNNRGKSKNSPHLWQLIVKHDQGHELVLHDQGEGLSTTQNFYWDLNPIFLLEIGPIPFLGLDLIDPQSSFVFSSCLVSQKLWR